MAKGCETSGNHFSKSIINPEQDKRGSVFIQGLNKREKFKKEIFEIIDYSHSPEKKLLYKSYVTKIFFSEVDKYIFGGDNIDEFEKLIQLSELRDIFLFCFKKYENNNRNNGEPVFIHLLKTALFTIRNFKNSSLQKIKIAILHDIIEDGLASFDEIKENFGDNIALGVLTLSKNDIFNFLCKNEKKLIEKSKILDKKGKIKNEIKDLGAAGRGKGKLEKLSFIQNQAYELYKKGKNIKNKEYFSRFESKEHMKGFIEFLAKIKKIILNDLDLESLVNDAIDVKLADRCHNLCTQWDPNNIKQIFNKIDETQSFLLPIAKKINKEAYHLLNFLIYKLRTLNIETSDGIIKKQLKDIDWKNEKILQLKEIEKNIFGDNIPYLY